MNTAFQPQRDMVLGHVQNSSVIFNEGSAAGKSSLYGVVGTKRAISISGRYFAAMEALNAFPLLDGLREGELPGLVVLNRLRGKGESR